MNLIAHRGNINGPQPKLENSPEYLDKALDAGYDVEIDIWLINDKLFLGHDGPQYQTTLDYLSNSHFWCHCKNIEALKYLLENNIHCFFHKTDDVTLTSKGIMWTFPRKKLMEGSVCVMPEYGYDGNLDSCSGICSDYVEKYK